MPNVSYRSMQAHHVLFQPAEHAQLCTQKGCKTKLPWSYRLRGARPCSTDNLSRVLKTHKRAHINGGRLFRLGSCNQVHMQTHKAIYTHTHVILTATNHYSHSQPLARQSLHKKSTSDTPVLALCGVTDEAPGCLFDGHHSRDNQATNHKALMGSKFTLEMVKDAIDNFTFRTMMSDIVQPC